MDLMQYSKKSSVTPLLSPSPKAYAVRSFIYSDLTREFADNSLNKEILKKTLQAKRLQKLRTDYELANIKVKKATLLNQKLQNHLSSLEAYKKKLLHSNTTIEAMNNSATKIQKVIRGYLARKHVEEKLLSIFKKGLDNELNSMAKNDTFCLFFVGKKPIASAITLQRWFRRCLFRKRIEILRLAYTQHEEAREIKRSQKFLIYFRFFHCRVSLKSAAEDKVFHIKLKKIREKLAVLKIKSLLKRMKLKLKNVRYRVKRYSKRFNNTSLNNNANVVLSPSVSPNPLERFSGSEFRTPFLNPEENIPSIDLNKEKGFDIDRFSHSTEYYINQDAQKKVRIEKGRIVYGIKNKSPTVYLPLFSDGQHENRPESTRALTIRMNLTNPMRNAHVLNRKNDKGGKKEIKMKKKTPKRYFLDETPPYMRETVNSKVKFEDTPSPQPSPKPYRYSAENRILYTTFSSRQKVKNQETESQKKIETRPATRPNTGISKCRKIIRSKQISCANFIEYNFDPPIFDSSDMFQQSFRPLYSKLKIRPESLKPKPRKLSL